MITKEQYYKFDHKGYSPEPPRTDIISTCCSAPVENIQGSYDNIGRIYNGYACTKCLKHLYDLKLHFKIGE